MMSQHLSSMFEQLGNFTKNNLTHNSKLKEKDNKSTSNHVACEGGGGKQQPSPSHKHAPAQPPPPLKKPCKLRNVASKAESYDTLYGISNLIIEDKRYLTSRKNYKSRVNSAEYEPKMYYK